MTSPEHLGALTDVPLDPAGSDTANAWTFRNLPSFRLHLLGGLSERYSEYVYRRLVGLKLLECRVIGVINSFGQVPFKQLCQETHLEKSYASRLVNRLSDHGLIDKVGSSTDQRSVVLSLTEEGRAVHRQLHARAVRLNERWMSVLSPQQQESFLTCLDLLTDQLRQLAASDGAGREPEPEQEAGPSDGAEPLSPEPPTRVVLDADLARRLHALLGAALSSK